METAQGSSADYRTMTVPGSGAESAQKIPTWWNHWCFTASYTAPQSTGECEDPLLLRWNLSLWVIWHPYRFNRLWLQPHTEAFGSIFDSFFLPLFYRFIDHNTAWLSKCWAHVCCCCCCCICTNEITKWSSYKNVLVIHHHKIPCQACNFKGMFL